MRTSALALALPALASAQAPLFDQVKGWFAKATDSLSSVLPSVPSAISIPNPIASTAAAIANVKVDRLTIDNYDSLLKAGAATATPGVETWMVYVTGGNKTCFGMCAQSDTAWNESVPLIAVSPTAPHLALLNCETDGVLCSAWQLTPPMILHMILPQPLPDQSQAPSIVRSIDLNRTTVTAPEIAAVHLQETYKETTPYEGFWHPFDSPLAKFGLAIPLGWAIWGFSQIPSWAFMILVSFASRSVMSSRMRAPPRGAAVGGAPAAAPAGT